MPGGQEEDKAGVAVELNKNNNEEGNITDAIQDRGILNINERGEIHEGRFCSSEGMKESRARFMTILVRHRHLSSSIPTERMS